MRPQFRARCIGSLAAVAFALSGCLAGWKYGAAEIYRSEFDTNGLPTYGVWGSLGDDETWEMRATKVMLAACPDGDPQLVSGYVTTWEGQHASRNWDATFTCNQPIPGIKTL
jgi:hypothetical protein